MDAFERKLKASEKRRRLKERAVAYLGGACRVCGYARCSSAFDFHHVDDRTKDFNISDRRSWTEALQRELDKCVLLCSNCHRETHAGLHPHLLELDRHAYVDGFEDSIGADL